MPEKKKLKHLFISYSSKDAGLAQKVCRLLERNDLKCWVAPRDLGPGRWRGGLREAIEAAGALVLLWTPGSDDSPQVAKEVAWAEQAKVEILPFKVPELDERELSFELKPWQAFPLIGSGGRLSSKLIVDVCRSLLEGRSNAKNYLITRGGDPYKPYPGGPKESVDIDFLGEETAESLRRKLARGRLQLKKPRKISVVGTLFPCALLSSGWWEKHSGGQTRSIRWRDELQEWFFHGFDEWGPSWDFTWDFEGKAKRHEYFIAQLGTGDEANSIPVLLTTAKARKLREQFADHWGGMEARVTAVLGHRRHFVNKVAKEKLELFGGLLDYCLFVDDDKKEHEVVPRRDDTSIYSGYLWKCVAPKVLYGDGKKLRLRDVYFLWEHVNFASKDALDFGLESLESKERRIRDRWGKLVLVQKSSSFVKGVPSLSGDAVYNLLAGKDSREDKED